MGALVAFILSGRTLSPIVQVGSIMTKLNSALSAFKRIDALMLTEAKDERFTDDNVVSITSGEILIKDFSYEIDGKLLQNINIKINEGERVGIIGPVGGGKSTLLKSLVGYYSVDLGSIMIDSFDINNIDTKTLRKSLAYVPQTIQLFSGRIQDNITAGLDDCSNDDIIAASKNANAHEFISALPGGYDAELRKVATIYLGQK